MSGDLPHGERIDSLERWRDDLERRFGEAFPGADHVGNCRYHQLMIDDIEARKRLRQAVLEKTIAGLVWGARGNRRDRFFHVEDPAARLQPRPPAASDDNACLPKAASPSARPRFDRVRHRRWFRVCDHAPAGERIGQAGAARHLNKTLLVDLAYFQRWIGEADEHSTRLVVDAPGMREALASAQVRLIAVQASQHQPLREARLDIAINIASIQEMDPPVIEAYFDDLRATRGRSLYFYCCNREEKRLPDGTVTRFREYLWNAQDEILVDELCPWHQRYYSLKPPFYRSYDGPIRHRLVRLATRL